jgi:predicted Zn-dependent protease
MRIHLRILLFFCANLILLSGCGKQHAEIAAASLANAQKLYSAGQFQSARAEIETAIKADPKVGDAHFLAAQIAEKLGDLQTALNEYVATDATGTGTNKARLAAAALLIRVQAYNLADQWIARCLAELPNDNPMKAYRALLKERMGNFRDARTDAHAILAEDKRNLVASAVLAEEALRRNDPADALIDIEAGLSADASDKALLQLKAQAFLQQEAPEKATEIYRSLVAVDPTIPEYRVALAELLAKSSDVAQGEQILRDGVEAVPGNINMRMQLVTFLARHRDEKTVVGELLSAIASAPDSTAYDIALADVYAQDKRFDAAAKVLNEAILRARSDPARSAAQLTLARLAMAHDETAQARTILDAMLKVKPTDDDALLIRGQLMLRDHNLAGAIHDFLSIAARQPTNASVFTALAEAYLQNTQRTESIAALKRALSIVPSDLRILRQIVDLQSSFGEVSEASRTVEDYLVRNSASVDARVMQAKLAIQSKDLTAADDALARLRKIPGSERKAIALDAEIKEARGQNSDAADRYRQLIIRSKFDMSDARSFARASIAAGQSSQGIDALEKLAATVEPQDIASYNLILATLFDSLDQVDKTKALIDAAIVRAPSEPAPYLQQAATFARKKKIDEALAALDRGIAAGAPKEPLLLARAEVQKSGRQVDNAVSTYRELLRINPKSALAANELANVLADQKPLDKVALREARDSLQKNALLKNQEILDTLAWLDYRLGEFDQAKDLLNLANARQTSNPQLRFHYGAVLVALGEITKGQEIIKSTLSYNYPGRQEAEKLIN